ncbi:MAG: hypothetical protein O9340_00215 [Cyclobacteriaceae bacterium]|jgi:hypothetical protein|nr:hypothetical protein [Cyclobacteriaceae bacterium]
MISWLPEGWKLDSESDLLKWGAPLSTIEKIANPTIHIKTSWTKVKGLYKRMKSKKIIWQNVEIKEIPSIHTCYVDYDDFNSGENLFFSLKGYFKNFESLVDTLKVNFGIPKIETEQFNDRGHISYYKVLNWKGPKLLNWEKNIYIRTIDYSSELNHNQEILAKNLSGEFIITCV